MLDSGSSISIVTEQRTEARDSNTVEQNNKSSTTKKLYRHPNKESGDTNDIECNECNVSGDTNDICDIECNGWKAGRADIIVVPNKHRAIVGRDLFIPLGFPKLRR